ncbi:hypothetical protein RHGRI_025014 [Rhododendron griersonianum]|uniref:Uncharacterized protein n=1 Tax=Rhododendron griersonianum TaxID=479676 RepID=A0AAV6JDU0_9ERIC|nr:hypothetical protein RHGRI_025014 [Rhododendron griersonianum]
MCDDGLILTCGHSSTRGRRFYIAAEPLPKLYWLVYSAEACFKGQKFVGAEVLAIDLRRDLALLKIPQSVLGSDGSQNHVGKILERELMIGEPLYLMGHPHGLPYCTHFGIFSGYRSPKEFSEAMQMGLSLASPPRFQIPGDRYRSTFPF